MDSPALVVVRAKTRFAVSDGRIRRLVSARGGFSLVELLAALVITLIVMGATVQLFGTVSNAINSGRAGLETNDRVRSAMQRLRSDLRGLTCDTLPWQQPAAANGYLEIIKVPGGDTQPTGTNLTTPGATLLGYTHDVLMLTTRSKDLPFVGRYLVSGNPSTAESQVAEVAWFMQPSLNSQGSPTVPPTYTLYRRVFLVRPDVGPLSTGNFYDNYDISAHLSGGQMIPNSLADLAYRENRFAHATSPAPFAVQAASLTPFSSSDSRFGEDVVLTNVLSFDIKVWDPLVPVRYDPHATTTVPGTPLVPSDPGYNLGTGYNPAILGAYVDLDYGNSPNTTYFSGLYYGNGQLSLLGQTGATYATYDLWPAGYEYYALGATGNGQSNNGFDDDGKNGVDDSNERISCPPYPVPLRGVQIKIRVYEPTTQQVREVAVTETFLPD